jgi:hypothetical protein
MAIHFLNKKPGRTILPYDRKYVDQPWQRASFGPVNTCFAVALTVVADFSRNEVQLRSRVSSARACTE